MVEKYMVREGGKKKILIRIASLIRIVHPVMRNVIVTRDWFI